MLIITSRTTLTLTTGRNVEQSAKYKINIFNLLRNEMYTKKCTNYILHNVIISNWK